MQRNVYHPQDYASFQRRTFADIIDGIPLTILFALAGLLIKDLAWLIQILIFLTYMIGLKVFTGTLGYRSLGIRIVAVNGSPLTVKQIVIRLTSSLLSVAALGLGVFWILIDPNNQAWHDKIAATYVIRADAKPAPATEIPQTAPRWARLLILLAFLGSVLFLGFYAGVFYIHIGTGPTAYDI